MNVGIQCKSMGQRCGIFTYASRVEKYLNTCPDVHAKIFREKYKNGKMDVMNIQYESGLFANPNDSPNLQSLVQGTTGSTIVVTAHNMYGLEQFYPLLEGLIIHDESQLNPKAKKPWNYKVIPHPALVYPKKDKIELRKKYGLPVDKKIIGTMGFICGTGKILPLTTQHLLKQMNDNEFLYLITPFWKGGDMGRYEDIMGVVKKAGKTNNFKIETDFMASEEVLNEKMQCCDLMYCWNNTTQQSPGSQSGSAADIYGSRVKMIVKNVPHFAFIAKQDKVLKGRDDPGDFATDVITALRTADLNDVQNPDWLSWENSIKQYVDYFNEVKA